MFRLLSQAPAQLPMSYGYILFGGGMLVLAALIWRLSRFSADRPK